MRLKTLMSVNQVTHFVLPGKFLIYYDLKPFRRVEAMIHIKTNSRQYRPDGGHRYGSFYL